ncbi:MAG: hypothetical protein IT184_15760 [Acidobacteria bacterium]|nr:hypothetical protein [Acidobacteriota bacterium]
MGRPAAAVFCMPDRGHFQQLRPVIAGLSRTGFRPHVYTHERFRPDIERLGGVCVDLFSRYAIEQADGESWPFACRYVTFAAAYGDAIAQEVRAIAPTVVVHDTFAVIGRVVAHVLRLPRVNVCAGHNVDPDRYIPIMAAHPRVHVSPQCKAAVARLRDDYGVADASPFSYVSNLSPDLNLYGEPPEFLPEAGRACFEPVAFFGSILEEDAARDVPARPYFDGRPRVGLKVYVSFGSFIVPFRLQEATAAFEAIAAGVSRHPGMQAVITLGGVTVPAEVGASIARRGVRIEPNVDQRRILQEADVFVTHHGLNSTHESIVHRVPMLSYPFIWDQPALAATCQRLGLAISLTTSPMAPLSEEDVDRAFATFAAGRDRLTANLARARDWEMAVIASRPVVLRRIRELCA